MHHPPPRDPLAGASVFSVSLRQEGRPTCRLQLRGAGRTCAARHACRLAKWATRTEGCRRAHPRCVLPALCGLRGTGVRSDVAARTGLPLPLQRTGGGSSRRATRNLTLRTYRCRTYRLPATLVSSDATSPASRPSPGATRGVMRWDWAGCRGRKDYGGQEPLASACYPHLPPPGAFPALPTCMGTTKDTNTAHGTC